MRRFSFEPPPRMPDAYSGLIDAREEADPPDLVQAKGPRRGGPGIQPLFFAVSVLSMQYVRYAFFVARSILLAKASANKIAAKAMLQTVTIVSSSGCKANQMRSHIWLAGCKSLSTGVVFLSLSLLSRFFGLVSKSGMPPCLPAARSVSI